MAGATDFIEQHWGLAMKKVKLGFLLLALSGAAMSAFADKGGVPHEGSNGIGRQGRPEASVPEPASFALLVTGLIGVAIVRRRMK